MLEVDGVEFAYPETTFHFDFTVERGEILGVIGPSGSGKTTLLQLLGGFLRVTRGGVRVNNVDITNLAPEARPLTSVFQEHNLFPHLRVFDNVALGIAPNLRLDQVERQRVHAALERVHLQGLADRRPGELSGGQRQRVTLARAMVRARPVLLLDEPFTALGPALRQELLDLIQELVSEQRMCAILVSHHPDDTRRVSPRTAFIQDGRIHTIADTTDLLDNQLDADIRDYLGKP